MSDHAAMNLRGRRAYPAAAAAIAALGLAATLGTSSPGSAQSYCTEVGPAAPIVCQNRYLMELAGEARDALRQLVQSVPRAERPALFREHRDWTFSLRQCLNGPSEECLGRAYEDRISQISQRLAGQVGGPPLTASREPVEQQPLNGFETDRSPQFGDDEPFDPDDVDDGDDPDQPPLVRRRQTEQAARTSDDDGDVGLERGRTQTAARPADDADAVDDEDDDTGDESDAARLLPTRVWKAQIASGVRPGTIFVFQRDGALVTADCVDSYRLGTWQIASNGTLEMKDSSGPARQAKIVGLRDQYVRLQLTDAGDGRAGTLVLRPAVAPFACKGDQ